MLPADATPARMPRNSATTSRSLQVMETSYGNLLAGPGTRAGLQQDPAHFRILGEIDGAAVAEGIVDVRAAVHEQRNDVGEAVLGGDDQRSKTRALLRVRVDAAIEQPANLEHVAAPRRGPQLGEGVGRLRLAARDGVDRSLALPE